MNLSKNLIRRKRECLQILKSDLKKKLKKFERKKQLNERKHFRIFKLIVTSGMKH